MSSIVIMIAAFVGVAALVGGVATLLRGSSSDTIEDRLEVLAGLKKDPKARKEEQSLLSGPLDDVPGVIEEFVSKTLQRSSYARSSGH